MVNAGGGEGDTNTDTRGGAGIGGGENGSAGTVIISGGSVRASGNSGGKDIGAGYNNTDEGTLKNPRGEDIYLNTLTISGKANADVTSAGYGVGNSYGITGVKTDAEGKLYFYLPACNEEESVDITAYGAAYIAQYTRLNNHENAQTMSFSIKSAVITLTDNPVYTGEPLLPPITVQSGGNTLTENTDYTIVSYTDNVNAGTARVTIAGMGDYKGTGSQAFTIGQADAPTGADQILEVVENHASDYDFNLTALLPAVNGLLGTVTYTPAITQNDDNVLGELNYVSGDTLTLPVMSVAGANKTAVVQVCVSSTNYKDFNANITVKTLANPPTDDYSDDDYVPTPTIPTADGAAQVSYTMSNGAATLQMPSSKVNEIIEKSGGETAVLDLSSVSGVTSAQLPKDTLSSFEKAGLGVAVRLPIGTMTFDSAAAASIAGQAADDSVRMELKQAAASDLSSAQSEAVGSDDIVLDINLYSGGQNISTFDGTMTIQMPYDGPLPVAVWYLNDAGELERLSCTFLNGVISFALNHLSLYVVGQDTEWQNPFIDVKSWSWHYDAVTFIAQRGITTGTSATTFSPEATLTRGQFITMLMRAYEIAPDASPADNFSDAGDTWYTGSLAAAKRLGIAKGVGDNKFEPEAVITRQEMFTLLYNTLKMLDRLPAGVSGKIIDNFFDGGDIASWATQALTALVKSGTVIGSGGYLKPNHTATRAEMVQVLYNLLNK